MYFQNFVAKAIHEQIQGWCIDHESKIARIKELRARTGLGLRESKECIEAWDSHSYSTDRINAIERVVGAMVVGGTAVKLVEPPEDHRLVWATGYQPYEAHSKAEACRFEAWMAAESKPFHEIRTFKQVND